MIHRHLVDVHVLLVDDADRVLLSRRRDTHPEFDGKWHLPSGKLDAGESVLHAAVREVREEVGVLVEPADLGHVHTTHVVGPGLEPRLGLFFATHRWRGHPANREPDKCSELRWFPLDDLPERIIAYPATGIAGYRTGTTFSTHGWPAP
ncbi:NUDIX hydrolase [Amycolatopsis arida]|uniref:NUDIX hydrolase n=1 Tax=Amycolatopsis arida TaxID=587909 RepID=UPI000B8688C5|nr:NUDIX domain-containing protein [Amycolatopsis arida]